MPDANQTEHHGWRRHIRLWNLMTGLLLFVIVFFLWVTLSTPQEELRWITPYLETAAIIAKYAGTILTTAMAIYGITHEFSQVRDGTKRLTSAGRRAVLASVLLAVLTIVGTTADRQLQEVRGEASRKRTVEELAKLYDKTKADLKDTYDAQKKNLETTYTQTTATLRDQFENGRLALENSLKPVENVTVRTTFRFPESMRSQLPPKPDWQGSGLSECSPPDLLSTNRCQIAWRSVSEDFFHPMLSYDVSPRNHLLDSQNFRDDYSLLMSFVLSRTQTVFLTVFPCLWKKSPYFQDETIRCIPDAFFFLGRIPGGYNPDAPDSPAISGVRYNGEPGSLELTTEFHIDQLTLDRFAKDSEYKQRKMVVGDFMESHDSLQHIPIETHLYSYPQNATSAELASGIEGLLARLPVVITMQVWVNDNPGRTRTVVFTKNPNL